MRVRSTGWPQRRGQLGGQGRHVLGQLRAGDDQLHDVALDVVGRDGQVAVADPGLDDRRAGQRRDRGRGVLRAAPHERHRDEDEGHDGDDDAGAQAPVPGDALGDRRAPVSQNTAHATTTMAAKFVLNSTSAPAASSQRPSSMQIPTVARGGTSETAMATPGSASLPVCRAATHAPARAGRERHAEVEEGRLGAGFERRGQGQQVAG